MSKIAKGIYPAPVYIAVTEDGAEHRLSFWSPKGKPVDCERGRRVADSILLTDWEAAPHYVRESDGALHFRRPLRASVLIHGRIVARYVEHESIGRVADGAEIIAKPQARVNWQKRASEARELLEHGNVTAALALLAA